MKRPLLLLAMILVALLLQFMNLRKEHAKDKPETIQPCARAE